MNKYYKWVNMTRKSIFWFIAVSLLIFVVCGAAFTLGVLTSGSLDFSNGLSTGEGIALIKVEGVIQPGEPPVDFLGASQAGAYSDRIVRQLKQANDDANVKAVVLRVDSPGGGVVASDEIYEQIVAMNKPVLISMGTLAASGGYYISAPADEIWANRHTLTGSIGVIIQFVNVEDFMNEYGVDATVVKSGLNKDSGSLFRTMTEAEKAIWQSIIDESYDTFVQIIVQGRNLNEATVRTLADGRVYTGQQAYDAGLVDHLGNLEDVINRAAELANIEGKPRIIEYNQPPSLFGSLLESGQPPSAAQQLQEILKINTGPTPMYLYGHP